MRICWGLTGLVPFLGADYPEEDYNTAVEMLATKTSAELRVGNFAMNSNSQPRESLNNVHVLQVLILES